VIARWGVRAGLIWHVVEVGGLRLGVVGLVESEWLETLPHLSATDVIFTDYVSRGRELAALLREREGVDAVIALTHMRDPNDDRLLLEAPELDLQLGGHDHHYRVVAVEGGRLTSHDDIAADDAAGACECGPQTRLAIKSGTDFRDLTKIYLHFPEQSPGARPYVVRLSLGGRGRWKVEGGH
jgi:5'-nucleotidase